MSWSFVPVYPSLLPAGLELSSHKDLFSILSGLKAAGK